MKPQPPPGFTPPAGESGKRILTPDRIVLVAGPAAALAAAPAVLSGGTAGTRWAPAAVAVVALAAVVVALLRRRIPGPWRAGFFGAAGVAAAGVELASGRAFGAGVLATGGALVAAALAGRRVMEERTRLAAMEERLTAGVRAAPVAGAAVRGGRVVEINAAAEALSGVASGAVEGREFHDGDSGLIAPAPGHDGWAAALADAEAGRPRRMPARLRRRDGPACPVEVSLYPWVCGGRPAVWCAIEDRSAWVGLADECRRLSAVVELADEAIAITDLGGRFIYVNRAFEIVTGYPRGEVLGRTPRLLQSGEHDPAFYRALWSTLRMGGVWTGRFRNRRKDGRVYTEEASIAPVADAAGTVTHFVAVKRDLSSEQELQRQLAHAQKMEGLGRLVGGVAHDFNNILQVITGNAALSRAELPSGHPVGASLAEIVEVSGRAVVLVRQLLAFSRKEELRFRSVNVDEMLAGMIRMLQRIIGEDIALVHQPTSARLFVNGDAGQLEQVLLNLCVNARDAMPHGGRIRIEVTLAVLDPAMRELGLPARPAGYVVVAVSDTGSGIPPELRERVFEPFFTTKEAGKGTGIGLATVKAIVGRHGGAVCLDSEVGVGTTFRVFLPAAAPAEMPDAAAEEVGRLRLQGRGEGILLVEDDDAVLRLGTRILATAGYRVFTARNGEEALAVHDANSAAIALAVLDVVMPRRNGRETRDELRRRAPRLPVVFATGYSDDLLGYKLGTATPVLRKPFAAQELLVLVRDSLAAAREAGETSRFGSTGQGAAVGSPPAP